jgi:hypothetical protein
VITGSGSASLKVRRYLTGGACKALFSYRHAILLRAGTATKTATTARTRAPALACHAGPAQAHNDSGPAEA